jgi:Lon protease-like protein
MNPLPLFPLNTVLFPGMPLALHIFEDRYQIMMRQCIEDRAPFVVVLIRDGDEAGGALAAPYDIGCTARIAEVEPLAEGRMNLVAVGDARFRVVRLFRDRPFLTGVTELIPRTAGDEATLAAGIRSLRPYVTSYLEILADATDATFSIQELPDAPGELADMAAYLLQAPPEHKQALLECPTTAELVADLVVHYRAEVPLLKAMLGGRGPTRYGPFSLS